VLLAICVALVVGGCSDGGRPETAPVSGTVTYNGEAVAGANVVFIPKEGGSRNASGTTDSQGKYQLTTFEENDGAVPGAYSVTIREGGTDEDLSAMSSEDPSAGYGAAMDAAASGGAPPAGEAAEEGGIPAKYADPNQSGLDRTVESGKNVFDFTLE
jgi:hypothetical protein